MGKHTLSIMLYKGFDQKPLKKRLYKPNIDLGHYGNVLKIQ